MLTGEIEVEGRKNRRLIKYEITETGCWNCTSHYKNRQGYPCIGIYKKNTLMSRYIYERNFGEIPKGLLIRHKCDNPTCINPSHLELGTNQENMSDKVNRNRQSRSKGELHGMAKITKNQVEDIRKDNRSQLIIAKQYKVSQSQISNIKKMKNWGN